LTVIVDSYAWVEFLTAGPRGSTVRERLESPGELVTPDIVLAEVARVFARQGMKRAQVEGHLRSIGALSTVLPVSVEIALGVDEADKDLREGARRRKVESPSFADGVILSFARHLRGRLLTGNPHFYGMPETDWIGR